MDDGWVHFHAKTDTDIALLATKSLSPCGPVESQTNYSAQVFLQDIFLRENMQN